MRLDIRGRDTWEGVDDQSWLGTAHGTTTCEPITLDGDAFLATWPDGNVPSGVVLGKRTADGLYIPYGNGLANGAEVARGHLFSLKQLKGTTAGTVGPVGAALYWHGQVIVARLPVNHGLDAAARVDLAQINYVG